MRLLPLVLLMLSAALAGAKTLPHAYTIESPDHSPLPAGAAQSQKSWLMQGTDHHLAVAFRESPRSEYLLLFPFPAITLGKDGTTFYFQTPEGNLMPVAVQKPTPQGVPEITLLKNCLLLIARSGDTSVVRLRVADRDLAPSLE